MNHMNMMNNQGSGSQGMAGGCGSGQGMMGSGMMKMDKNMMGDGMMRQKMMDGGMMGGRQMMFGDRGAGSGGCKMMKTHHSGMQGGMMTGSHAFGKGGQMMGGHYGGGMYGSGLGLLGPALSLVFWAVVIFLLYKLATQLIQNFKPNAAAVSMNGNNALELIKERYAKGEINSEEFEEKKKMLQ